MNTRMRWQDTSVVDTIVQTLQKGQIVAGTSDTVVGLIAPLTKKGFEKLNTIKGRSDKPYLVLVSDMQQADQFSNAFTQEPVKTLATTYWPGPLTLIVPAKKSVPSYATSSSGAIALRVPHHPGLQQIANRMGGIFSTSANRTDQPVPQTIDELDPLIQDMIALIIDDYTRSKKLPSTILDCTGNRIKLVREGALTNDTLRPSIPTRE